MSGKKAPLLSLAEPGAAALETLLRGQQQEPCSYPDIGATRAEPPSGYRHGREAVRLGRGEATFARAIDGLRRWQAHTGAGFEVYPPDRGLQAGATVVLVSRLGPLHAVVACRIVYLVEEADRFGFAYGTLPHHVLQGEEAFVVAQDAVGDVHFRINAFSRPGSGPLRLAAPAVHALDQRVMRRYLRAMQRHTAR